MNDSSNKASWGIQLCRYGSSPLIFRGPAKPLDGRHIAFVGSSETVGRNAEFAYPEMLETELGEVCINLAQTNASMETFLYDTVAPNVCRDSILTVVSIMSAANLSNRLYSVHPRRNDRFIKPSPLLRALFPDVSFHEICFVRHLLGVLQADSPQKFELVQEELKAAWAARMKAFLDRIGSHVILVSLQAENTSLDLDRVGDPSLGTDPLFVTESMVETLRSKVQNIVTVRIPYDRQRSDQYGAGIQGLIAQALLPHIEVVIGVKSMSPVSSKMNGRQKLKPAPQSSS